MNIFFTRKYIYRINSSIDEVVSEIELIIDRRWYDFSINITGRFIDIHNFKLTHKWSFAAIRRIENSPAFLSGTLSEDGNKTIINTTLRPNSFFVIFFYFLSILFLCELLGIDTFIQGPKKFKLLFLAIFNLILFGLMQIFTTGLRNRFEKLLYVNAARYIK